MAIAGLVTGIVGAAVASFLLVVNIRLTNECQDEKGAEIAQHEAEFSRDDTGGELATCIEDNNSADYRQLTPTPESQRSMPARQDQDRGEFSARSSGTG